MSSLIRAATSQLTVSAGTVKAATMAAVVSAGPVSASSLRLVRVEDKDS